MFKQKRIWFIVLLVLLVSTLAWGTLYHEGQRSMKVASPVYKRKPAIRSIAKWQSAKIPTAIDHTQADSLDKKMQSIDFAGSVLVVRGGKAVFEKQYGNANAARKRQNNVSSAYAIASI